MAVAVIGSLAGERVVESLAGGAPFAASIVTMSIRSASSVRPSCLAFSRRWSHLNRLVRLIVRI